MLVGEPWLHSPVAAGLPRRYQLGCHPGAKSIRAPKQIAALLENFPILNSFCFQAETYEYALRPVHVSASKRNVDGALSPFTEVVFDLG